MWDVKSDHLKRGITHKAVTGSFFRNVKNIGDTNLKENHHTGILELLVRKSPLPL